MRALITSGSCVREMPASVKSIASCVFLRFAAMSMGRLGSGVWTGAMGICRCVFMFLPRNERLCRRFAWLGMCVCVLLVGAITIHPRAVKKRGAMRLGAEVAGCLP